HERRPPGRQLPPPGPADLPDDAAPSPLRAHRLGRGEDHDAVLDRGRPRRPARLQRLPADLSPAVSQPMTATPTHVRSVADLRGRRSVVLGLARSGVAACRFLADAGAEVVAYDRRRADELADAVAALDGRSVRLELGADPARVTDLLADAEL